MIKLTELLDNTDIIKIIVEKEDYREFLKFAKEEGCLWSNGEVIKPVTTLPIKFPKTITITKHLLINSPSGFMSFMSICNKPKYLFTDLKKKNLTIDNPIIKSSRTEKLDKELQSNRDAILLMHKNKCAENRKINQLQLKYQDKAHKLQNQFFVRYENDDELLLLFILFKNYGYENIYNITLDNFPKDPKIICLNNQDMTFYPADKIICSYALNSNKKFYKTNDFIKIINDIFKD